MLEQLKFFIYLFLVRHYHQCSDQGQVFHSKLRLQGCILPKGRSSTANSGTKVAVSLGMNRCGNFPCFPHPNLFSIWTDLTRSEKIPGGPAYRWREWIWLTGPSVFHRNSPQGLNISSTRGFLTRLEIRKSQSPFVPLFTVEGWNFYRLFMKDLTVI